MKILTLNFLTCAAKSCKTSSDSFPLHPRDAELVHDDIDVNPELLTNVLTRVDWKALRTTSTEVSGNGFFLLSGSRFSLSLSILFLFLFSP